MKEESWLIDLIPADLEACNFSSGFLQSGYWGSFKARFGWNARSFEAVWKQGPRLPLLVIRRRLGSFVSFAYVPWGPELPQDFPDSHEDRQLALKELAHSLKQFLPNDTAFIRFEPPWFYTGEETPSPLLNPPFLKAVSHVQAPDTVFIDLDRTEEAILKGMKSKWRYNTKLALKRGIIIRRPDEQGLDIFYSLLRETAKRDKIYIHSFDYYKTLFDHTREYQEKAAKTEYISAFSITCVPELHLYTAEHEGDVLAAIIVLFRGDEAVYLYGASSDSKRNLMAPYALQLKAMLDAKQAGCRTYDLFGIPPKEDPKHPLSGLYRFKTGFGGSIIHRPGAWDYPYKRLLYSLFRKAEFLRNFLRGVRRG